MTWYRISDGQFLFNRSAKGLMRAFLILLWAVIFSPLLVLGYWIDTKFISLKSPGHVWLIAVLVTALCLYALLFLCKSLIIGLRRRHSIGWIPLFLFCIAFTCILPGVIMFPIFSYLTAHTIALSWVLDLAFVYAVYAQYNFLNQRLPLFPYSYKP